MKENDVIKLALQAGILKDVERSGWNLKNIDNPESVADHTFRVAFLAMILSQDKKDLDVTKVLKMALLHEIGETVVGDVVYEHGINTVASLENKHRDERNALQQIFQHTTVGKDEYIDLWEEWVAQKTSKAQFLKRVEKLEMAIQAYEYQKKGYAPELFTEFWENAWKYIRGSDLQPILEELEKMRRKNK